MAENSKPGFFKNFLARQLLRFIDNSKFVGVAGSCGKTTTLLACKSILSQKMEVLSTADFGLSGSANLPKAILGNKSKYKKVLLEIESREDFKNSLLHKIDLKNLIITRISPEMFSDEVEGEILQLIERIPKGGTVIFNGDDMSQRRMLEKGLGEVIFYGMDSKNNHLWAGNLRIVNFGTSFELNYGVERVEINSKLLGFHQVYPMLAAATLGIGMGFSLINIKKGLEKLESVEHRFQPFSGANNSVVIDDTCNGDPLATLEALEALNHISGKRRIVVLGGLDYFGVSKEQVYLEVARKIYKDQVDHVFLTGGDAKMIGEELIKLGFSEDRIDLNLNNSQIVSDLLRIVSRGDLVLVKGSSSTRLDEVVKRISKK